MGLIIWVATVVLVVRYRAGAKRPLREKSESKLEYVAAVLTCVAVALVLIRFSAMDRDRADPSTA